MTSSKPQARRRDTQNCRLMFPQSHDACKAPSSGVKTPFEASVAKQVPGSQDEPHQRWFRTFACAAIESAIDHVLMLTEVSLRRALSQAFPVDVATKASEATMRPAVGNMRSNLRRKFCFPG